MCFSRLSLLPDYHWPHNMDACCSAEADFSTCTSDAAAGATSTNGAVVGEDGGGGRRGKKNGGEGVGEGGVDGKRRLGREEKGCRQPGCFTVCAQVFVPLSLVPST